jgi:hypothetical protein
VRAKLGVQDSSGRNLCIVTGWVGYGIIALLYVVLGWDEKLVYYFVFPPRIKYPYTDS